MTTTDTRDTRATGDQIERLAGAGCEIVRVTAPSITDAENLAEIRRELDRRRVRVPLVADIHFTPNAAMVAALHVEKVRINPGNFADKKRFEVREYTDPEYAEEVRRVAERFRPLVRRLKQLGRALRIGTNHGSLSDRILNRHGDTPRGMVESALEFLDVCEDEGFRDVIFSMKASNAQVAIQAYRLLAARLAERESGRPSYPFHLGVTEAGDGEDGRIKSAIGIGALLEDGIGDTIRVSLTEDPVKEVPVARALARRYDARFAAGEEPALPEPGARFVEDPYDHARRATRVVVCGGVAIGGSHPVRVELELGPAPDDPREAARELCRSLRETGEVACEGLLIDTVDAAALERAARFSDALRKAHVEAPLALRVPAELAATAAPLAARLVVPLGPEPGAEALRAAASAATRARRPLEWNLRAPRTGLGLALDAGLAAAGGIPDLLVSVEAPLPVHAVRYVAARLAACGAGAVPLVLRHASDSRLPADGALLHAATDLGAPLCDGIGDAVAVSGLGDPGRTLALAYRILQGARLRTTWTEFISCPSCGRTLFDLEETTARIKARTQHLAGVKIAIMGCIVNGPGEMADADFGYVGSGPGRVNLYVGKTLVERNVAQGEADDRLVALIKQHGAWRDPGGDVP
jgi:(E)-4-hydroxy-3-methylbut-2-enyl-diphosphate synthase